MRPIRTRHEYLRSGAPGLPASSAWLSGPWNPNSSLHSARPASIARRASRSVVIVQLACEPRSLFLLGVDQSPAKMTGRPLRPAPSGPIVSAGYDQPVCRQGKPRHMPRSASGKAPRGVDCRSSITSPAESFGFADLPALELAPVINGTARFRFCGGFSPAFRRGGCELQHAGRAPTSESW